MADPIEEARRQTAAEAYEAHMRTVHHLGIVVVDDVAAYTPVAEDFWLPSRLAAFDIESTPRTKQPWTIGPWEIDPRYWTKLMEASERGFDGLTSDQAGEIEKLKPPPAPATKPPNEALARAIGAKKP